MVKQLARLPQRPFKQVAREESSAPLLFSSPRWQETVALHAGTQPASALAHGHDFTRMAVQPQAKLTVSQPGDPAEQEADRVADHVMRMSAPESDHVAREEATDEDQQPAAPAAEEEVRREYEHDGNTLIAREGDEDKDRDKQPAGDENEEVQAARQEGNLPEPGAGGLVKGVVQSGGQPLDAQTRSFMEPRFGHDFSQVRIHTDARASSSAEAVAARAYTLGNAIVFRSGEYAPGTSEGKRLLAHELTHVVQQNGDAVRKTVQRQADDNAEPDSNTNGMPPDAAATEVALPDYTVEMEEEGAPVHGKSVHLEGATQPTFSARADWSKKKAEPATGCDGCTPDQCVHVTGTIRTVYSVATQVTLPSVSDFPDLTPCEQGKVRDAIKNILAPHEQQHVRAFHTYDGTTSRKFDQTLCQGDLQTAMQTFVTAEQAPRQAKAQAASDALNPFNFDFDLDCDDQP